MLTITTFTLVHYTIACDHTVRNNLHMQGGVRHNNLLKNFCQMARIKFRFSLMCQSELGRDYGLNMTPSSPHRKAPGRYPTLCHCT